MKSLLKIFAITTAALSALLSLTFMALWIRGLSRFDGFYHYDLKKDRQIAIEAFGGEVSLEIVDEPFMGGTDENQYLTKRLTASHDDIFLHGRTPLWRHLGISYDRLVDTLESTNGTPSLAQIIRQWVVPLWMLIVLFGIMPVWLVMGSRRRRRRLATKGICIYCGYDLRATPDRCPECGKIPPHAPLHVIR